MALHQFEPGAVVWRLSDGAVGDVLSRTALYARIRVRGTFPEVLEVEQGDPGWFYDVEATSALWWPTPPTAKPSKAARLTTVGRI